MNLKKLVAFLELLSLLLMSAATVTAAAQTAPNTAGQAAGSGGLPNARAQERPSFNPNSTTHYTTGIMPSTTIKAAEYGALCNGTNDDTAAIQAAVNGLSVVSGGVGLAGPLPMGSGTVELPQGRCEISAPIILMNYGSLIGSANGTWMTPKEPWKSSNTDMVEVAEAYDQSSFNHQSVSLINRFVKTSTSGTTTTRMPSPPSKCSTQRATPVSFPTRMARAAIPRAISFPE